ncbi:tRNA1(Val) A37 N6-methylase TrmN6 [Alkalibacterium olivapovliticus]|uniref:tRNA1(Val) A37 N6-methylase TrmN6 n=2 Tax=Alkalibacterium olivapovliticus TaxID=99907 RepID=A0A2T0W795_9LACT|nr:tRNA1(Val) A37 N6-methylase TrmN6 [Alkalibacterium olivapovliticus]
MTIRLKEDERIDQIMQYGLDIIQSPSVFSFSLDAILLGEFAKVPRHDRARIVDLCSGNGAVALMISQQTKSKVTAVEIQDRLVDMAERSIELNGLRDQIEIVHEDVNTLTGYIPKDSVDVITCNPPYFTVSEASKKNPNEHLAIARHELHLTLKELMSVTSGLLKTKGKAFFVHRPERFLEIMDAMREVDLAPKRIQFIHPKAGREANIMLIEGIKRGKADGLKILPPLVVYDDNGDYFPEVRRMIYGNESD